MNNNSGLPAYTRKLKAIALDYDGTISCIRQGWEQQLRDFYYKTLFPKGMPQPSPKLAHSLTEIENFIAGCAGTSSSVQMNFLRRMILKNPDSGTLIIPSFIQLMKSYQQHTDLWVNERLLQHKDCESELLFKGARASLEYLSCHDWKVYLVSATEQGQLQKELNIFGLSHHFHQVIGSDENTCNNFKEKALKEIAAQEDCEFAEILVLGDGPAEINAALKLGCRLIGVAINEIKRSGLCTRKQSLLEQCGCTTLLHDYAEFPALLSSMLMQD